MRPSGGPAVPVAVRGVEDGTVVVSGDVDLLSAPELRECVARCIADGCFDITVDLAAVSFIDSSGIAALAATRTDLQSHGGRLVIQHPSSQARRVMDITGLSDLVVVVADDDNGAGRER